MNRTDFEEAVAVLRGIVATTRGVVESADLRRACGALTSSAPRAVAGAKVGAPLLDCITIAVNSGAAFDALDRARLEIADIPAIGSAARGIRRGALQLIIAAGARVLAATDIVSRAEADGWLSRMNDAFDAAEDLAASDGDISQHRALVALHAAVANDLVTRGRPLPAMVEYRFSSRLPSLTLANSLYGDGGRAEELVRENRPIHPLFMPRVGQALSR